MQGCRCMKHFKHLEPGMSFIEVVVAIGILAMFGTSLFTMQTYLFERIVISQRKIIANLRMQTELIAYQTDILKELFAQKGPVQESLKPKVKEFESPEMTVKIQTVSDFKETPLKNYKNLYLIEVQAANQDKEYGHAYYFTYIPKVAKK